MRQTMTCSSSLRISTLVQISLSAFTTYTCTAATFVNTHTPSLHTSTSSHLIGLSPLWNPSPLITTSSIKLLAKLPPNSNNDHNHHNHHNDDLPPGKSNIPNTLVDTYTPLLNQRLSILRIRLLEEQLLKPPNPNLNPIQVISSVLQELHNGGWGNNELTSSPDSGFRTLLRSSTDNWRELLYKSVGAPLGANEEQIVSALSSAMSRPNNQYQILVCSEDEDDGDDDDEKEIIDKKENYHLYFPNDVFEYDEGKAWVESQLRHPKTGKLLAILAWSLVQRESDGSWLIDGLDWQDFRDAFRPGIGKEEWPRICG